MLLLRDFIAPRSRLLQQQQHIKQLQRELATLKAQSQSMREGMRRCVSCEYRIDYKQRQSEQAPGAAQEQ